MSDEPGLRLADAVRMKDADVEAFRVTCETCPVSMQCIVGQGGTGWTFDCCGSTTIYLTEEESKARILLVDCGKHNFERQESTKACKQCALCSGGIMEVEARGMANHRYLPTVHAKVPVAERLRVLRQKLPEVEEKLRLERDEEAAKRAAKR